MSTPAAAAAAAATTERPPLTYRLPIYRQSWYGEKVNDESRYAVRVVTGYYTKTIT